MQTRAEHYGSIEESYRQQIEVQKATCLEKYGYEHACQFPEIKEKIAQSTRNTFLKKYQVENYWQLPDAKRSNGSKNSTYNLQFAELLRSNNISYEAEKQVGGKYFDFCVRNTLIEINPSPTHNTNWSPFASHGIDLLYHKNKTDIANQNGFKCIHVFDWDDQNKIIKMLQDDKEIIAARKCEIFNVKKDDEIKFLEKNHLQGYVKSKVCLGLSYQGKLVSLMSFGKPRYSNKYDYELLRYVSIAKVIGGAERLFKNFINTYKPNSIVSYCDLSKFSGDLYRKLNFKLKCDPNPSRHWYNIETKMHITDNLLRQRGFDQLFGTNYGKGTPNDLLMLDNGFVEIYDCGQATYVWRKE